MAECPIVDGSKGRADDTHARRLAASLCEFELDVLRLTAGRIADEKFTAGAALWQAIEVLRGNSLIEGDSNSPTELGIAVLDYADLIMRGHYR